MTSIPPTAIDITALTQFVIHVGADWAWSFAADDADTGEPFDFTTDPAGTWAAAMDIRTADGTRLARLDSTGDADGLITFDSEGNITATLPRTVTAAMTPTSHFALGPSSAVYADLFLTDPDDGSVWRLFACTGAIASAATQL